MKIIMAGKQAGAIQQTCQDSTCEAVVELEPSDCRLEPDCRDGDAITWRCPTCQRANWVNVDLVPGAFVRAVRDHG